MATRTDREILMGLIGSLTLSDHIGDVADDVWYALKKLGIEPPDEIGDLSELGTWLGKEHGVTTLYGTMIYDPEYNHCKRCEKVTYACECEEGPYCD